MPPFLLTIGAIVVGAAPGVIVALVGQYFAYRQEESRYRRMIGNGRRLVALELRSNLAGFQSFWREINDLDADHNADDLTKHLEGMAYGGLLGRPAPRWTFARWETSDADTLAALDAKEVEQLEQVNLDLRAFADLYAEIITLSPQEQTQISSGGSMQRFWGGYFATWRQNQFTRLNQLAKRILSASGLLDDTKAQT
jgi:hypothetical protein